MFANHYEVQSNFVLVKNFGLSAGFNGGFKGQLGGELAGIYYKQFNEKNYFEVQYGYGFFYNKTRIPYMAWSFLAGERGTWYSSNSDTRYHKIFVQPTYIITKKKVNFGFAVKISANYFDKYYYYRCKTEQDYTYLDHYSNVDFRYKWGFVFEPAFRIQFKDKLFLQLSGVLSNNIHKYPAYWSYTGHEGGIIDEGQNGFVHTPQHINFLFTIGYEIKFGKKKE